MFITDYQTQLTSEKHNFLDLIPQKVTRRILFIKTYLALSPQTQLALVSILYFTIIDSLGSSTYCHKH